MIAPAGKLRIASMVSLCLVFSLPFPAGAAEPPAPVDFAEGFDADPALDPGWELGGAWTWNGEKGVLASTPGCADSAVWKSRKLITGILGARLMLQSSPAGAAPRASLVFARQDSANYRYATLVAGSAATTGKVILGQKGVVGGLPEGRFASAAVDVATRTWLKLKLRLAPSGVIKVYLNGRVVALTPRGAPVAPVEGETGLEAGGRVRLDYTHFQYAYRQVISGEVVEGLDGLAGVPVHFSNGGGAALTDASGSYTHAVPWGWSGTASPRLEALSFRPGSFTSGEYSSVTEDLWDQDFRGAAPALWGSVRTASGQGVGGVTVSFSDGVSVVTDGLGNYWRDRPSAWPCTATPETEGWSFDPASRTYDGSLPGYPKEDYAAAAQWPVVSGCILSMAGTGVAGVILDFAGLGETAPTGPDGLYVKAVPPGWSGRVRPSGGGWAFVPPFRDYAPVYADAAGGDYLEGQRTFRLISGTVLTDSGNGRRDVSLVFSGGQGKAATELFGRYAKSVSPEWAGSATPSFRNWSFDPPSRGYPPAGVDVAGEDYVVFPRPENCLPCHDSTPAVRGTATAPNVMGNGYMFYGDPAHATPKRYDEGSWGFYVNGHGREFDTADFSHGNDIEAICHDCHDLEQSPETHLDGINQGRDGLPSANTFHLRTGFINAAPVNPWDVQVTFDEFCWRTCHWKRTTNMRHQRDDIPAPDAMEFGTHYTYDEPQNPSGLPMYIDRDLTSLAAFEGAPKYGTCVSCHNPHGNSTVSPRADQNNKMVIYRWQAPAILCAKCHN